MANIVTHPTSVLERGGSLRPSRSRTVLIVSADPAVRTDWARCFEALGMRTRRCVGPQVLCVLLDGGRHCPLHDEADLAIYDEAALTPELILRLVRARHSLPIAFAKDRLNAAGHHEPLITSVASQGRDDDACATPTIYTVATAQILAERFARGEIDAEEFGARTRAIEER